MIWRVWTKDAIGEWRMILTLIPIRPFYQTSAGMASVGNGRLRMRRHDHIRKVTLSHKQNQDVGDRSGRGA